VYLQSKIIPSESDSQARFSIFIQVTSIPSGWFRIRWRLSAPAVKEIAFHFSVKERQKKGARGTFPFFAEAERKKPQAQPHLSLSLSASPTPSIDRPVGDDAGKLGRRIRRRRWAIFLLPTRASLFFCPDYIFFSRDLSFSPADRQESSDSITSDLLSGDGIAVVLHLASLAAWTDGICTVGGRMDVGNSVSGDWSGGSDVLVARY